MKTLFQLFIFFVGFQYLVAATTPPPATSATISVTIDPTKVIGQVPPNYYGVCDSAQDVATYDPTNTSLINLFRTTGMHHLSIKDFNYTNDQLDKLFGFAKAANVKVLMMMQLNPDDVDTVHHVVTSSFQTGVNQSIREISYIITQGYMPYVDCFCIANEPDYYKPKTGPNWDYTLDYEPTWTLYVKKIQEGLANYKATATSPVTPLGPVMFCGPSAANNKPPGYFLNFEKDFSVGGSQYASEGKYISFASQHLYLIGSSSGEKTHTTLHSAQKMIASNIGDNVSAYNFLCGGNGTATPPLTKPILPYRQEECGAYSQHGVNGASNTFSASLWALDYEFWWATHGCLGVDYCQLSNGDDFKARNGAAYNTFFSSFGSTDYNPPIVTAYGNAYGMLAFKLGTAGSTLVSASVGTATALPAGSVLSGTYGISAYATTASDNSVYVTLINKDSGTNDLDGKSGIPTTVSIDLPAGSSISTVQSISLTTSLTGGPGNVSAVAGGIYMGGSAIDAQGNFTPNWKTLTPTHTNSMNVTVSGASVTILKISPMPAAQLTTVLVSASQPIATVLNSTPGEFTFSRTGDTTQSLTVNYTVAGTGVAGTDYTALPTSATIPAGASSINVPVKPIDNSTIAANPTVQVTLTASPNYQMGTSKSALAAIQELTFNQEQDIGNVGVSGGSSYNQQTGVYSIEGSGGQIYGTQDAFHYIYESTSTPCTIVARVIDQAQGKTGIMFRQSTDPSSAFVDLTLDGDGTLKFQARNSTGADAHTLFQMSGQVFPMWLKLVQSSTQFSAYTSKDGETWKSLNNLNMTFNGSYTVGMEECSYNNVIAETGMMDNVAVLPSVSWSAEDIGSGPTVGVTDDRNTVFTHTGSGVDIWNTADQFHFTYQPLTGDGTIVVRVIGVQNVNPWTKAGLMVRETLDENSANAALFATPANGVSFQWRPTTGANCNSSHFPNVVAPVWLKLTRTGDTVTGSYSTDGVTWPTANQKTFAFASLPATVYIGLATTSHDANLSATSLIDNVTAPTP